MEPISAFAVYKKTTTATNGAVRKRSKKPKVQALIGKASKRKPKLSAQKVTLALQEENNANVIPAVKFKTEVSKPLPTTSTALHDQKSPTIKPSKTKKKLVRKKPKVDAYETNNPLTKSQTLFEWIISPMLPTEFFNKYWEKQPLHIRHENKTYFKHLLSSRELDAIIRDNDLHYNRNVDVVVYENDEKRVIELEGKVTPSTLWDYYKNGCSVRFLNPQSYNKKLHSFITIFQEYFGSMTGVNAYLTPPNSQGFAPHFDDIEAFIIQLEGRKLWKLYHPTSENVLARFSSGNYKRCEVGEPFKEVTLEAGSVLYFPRGVIHEGSTEEEHSLHITVSVYQNNAYVDLLEKILPKALSEASKNDVTFRQGLPLHYLKGGHTETVEQVISVLFEKLKAYLDIQGGINELGRKLVYDSMPPVLSPEEKLCSSKQDGDRLDQGVVYNGVIFEGDTKVRLTRYYCIQLIEENDECKLYYSTENSKVYHGEDEQFLVVDKTLAPAIRQLSESYPTYIRISDLEIDVDLATKGQLIYDLWDKGIVITEKPLAV